MRFKRALAAHSTSTQQSQDDREARECASASDAARLCDGSKRVEIEEASARGHLRAETRNQKESCFTRSVQRAVATHRRRQSEAETEAEGENRARQEAPRKL